MDLDRPADAVMCLREAVDTYTLRLGADAPPAQRAREKLEVAQRALSQRSPAPATQPLTGYGKPADEVAWFGCLSKLGFQEGNVERGVGLARWVHNLAVQRDGHETDTSREFQAMADRATTQPSH
jgi:hypothetical protein